MARRIAKGRFRNQRHFAASWHHLCALTAHSRGFRCCASLLGVLAISGRAVVR